MEIQRPQETEIQGRPGKLDLADDLDWLGTCTDVVSKALDL